MADTSALKKIMQNIFLGVGRLPSAKFDNLAEWDNLAPPIIAAAEAVHGEFVINAATRPAGCTK